MIGTIRRDGQILINLTEKHATGELVITIGFNPLEYETNGI